MSYKFDSLIIILNKLDQGETVTIRSLMDDLELSERTVHRYLATLQTAFPISYDRRKGSYIFEDGYTLKRPDLSREEVVAFALARNMLTSLGPGMEKGLESIACKISMAAGKPPERISIEPEHGPAYGSQHIIPLQEALSRKALRTFALDRIVELKSTERHFVPSRLTPEDELSTTFGTWLDDEEVEVVARFEQDIKPYVMRKKWHQSQKDKELPDGRLELRFVVNGIEDIKKWLYQWIPYVEVISPEGLRGTLISELSQTLKTHKTTPIDRADPGNGAWSR